MTLTLFTPRPPLLPLLRLPHLYTTSIHLSRSDNNHPPNPTTAPSKRCKTPTPPHPAFSRAARGHARIPIPDPAEEGPIRVTDRGLAYRLDSAPFEFQYSYTESPRAQPLALREVPFLPFGPEGSQRPWTGRRPLPKSRKEVPEFDSFRLPPPGKKSVKPVQSPGPFLAGVEPRYEAASREEVMGESLTAEEVVELVKSSLKTKRQLNIGRDGLTHNMLENIHAHWKRKRVCKIKCKGVCTVDMDNVCQQLEEKVGGKVIHRHGGVVFLFRGRNYNYRTRPRFPLMLWKPIAPVYPRLVKKVPDGLTLEEAIEMRKRARELLPICTLGKNGVYVNLVKQVREAFEACDLVRVNCSGLNKSDCRKIGAKLKDLVPCVLLSFEFEHILIWRGKYWKSSFPALEENIVKAARDQPASINNGYCLNNQVMDSGIAQTSDLMVSTKMPLENISLAEGAENLNHLLKSDPANDILPSSATANPGFYDSVDTVGYKPSASRQLELSALDAENDLLDPSRELSCKSIPSYKNENRELVEGSPDEEIPCVPLSDYYIGLSCSKSCDEIDKLETTSGNIEDLDTECRDSMKSDLTSKSTVCSYLERVLLLLKQAVHSGRAVVLDEDEFFDADLVYQKSVAFMKTAPKGPAFQHMPRKCTARRNESDKQFKHDKQYGEHKVSTHTEKKDNANKGLGMGKRNDAQEFVSDVVPQGTLRVDELAKLLA